MPAYAGILYFGGVDGTVKKTHPSTFLTNKIKDLVELLIKGNRKIATNSVTTAKRMWILSVFFVIIWCEFYQPLTGQPIYNTLR